MSPLTNSVYFDGAELNQLAVVIGKAAANTGRLAQLVMRKTARDIVADAKSFAPVDTGNLKNSIGHSDLRTVGTSDDMAVEIGPTANYGIYVEFGTTQHAPAAFMGPAADRRFGPFEQSMAQLAEDGLNG
ncbi:HK97-gp10 family putative phage morphogenesis protein [Arthrobacter sp. CP30]